jgi:glycosidase
MNAILQSLRLLLTTTLIGWLVAVSAAAADVGGTNGAPHQAPSWLRSAVFYEIFPRNFSAAGDFNSITARLVELKDLGVDTLWLMPIHPLGLKAKKGSVGSPYCVQDFYAINPDYGTTNDFKHLIEQAHERGMKVIMDIVAGHTAWDSVMMVHPEFYTRDAAGNIHPPYPEWTDVAELNYTNSVLRQYMIDMMAYWLRDFGVDGFRCDTAFTVPVDFWEEARVDLEKVKPQVVIITDSGARPALLSKAFDLDYSGNLYETLNGVIIGEQPASLLKDSWDHTREQFSKEALHLRFTDHHNMSRATVRFGLAGALAAQTFMLMLDGVPLFYNGMEVGDATESADPALFEKAPVFWQPGGRPPLRSIYRDLIKLRKQHAAFMNNDVTWLSNSAPNEVVSLLRQDAKDQYLAVINFSNRKVAATVDLPAPDGWELVKIAGFADPVGIVPPDFRLNGFGWFIYHRSVAK